MNGNVILALTTSGAATVAWAILTMRMTLAYFSHDERRPFMLAMPLVGLIASLGTLASAIGFAVQMGTPIAIDRDVLTLIASMGRGALLSGALIALAYYDPRPHR